MEAYVDRYGAGRIWLAVVGSLVALITLAAVVFPHRVAAEILWHYYWGPVAADAQNYGCIAWNGGSPTECGPNTTGPEASPGYTWQSYAGYIPTLVLMLVGIILLIKRLEIDRYRAGFYGLFPFMLFGGALRVVEDANVRALVETGEMPIGLPWVAALISPFIYGTVFLVALFAVVVSVWLDRSGYVSGYEYPLAGIGTAALTVTVAYLGYFAATHELASFYPLIPLITLVGATVVTAITYGAITRFAPDLNRGTGFMGAVVIWAHSVDGIANVIGLDWASAFGLGYSPKHPVNEWIVTTTEAVFPASVVDVIGAAWPFLIVKVVAAVFIIWVFDESIFEESPRYAILLLITVVAVGLGPGTRDMLRATFGI
ncbi:DUF63 family protein [Natronosalvus halobius]|uniref:DUF63 family protein n=1 Tax=Natronosalvus halobius TaxID=2953746 RepID=UPI00209D9332|nr:DUF63 family protein [Natronosalvus halobius]USZ72479.1 DUF63 family protein [Natronosalvus halobius]